MDQERKKRTSEKNIPEFRSKYHPDPDAWPFSKHEESISRSAREIWLDLTRQGSPLYWFDKFGIPPEKDYETFFLKHSPKGEKYDLVRERFNYNLKVRWEGEVEDKEERDMKYRKTIPTARKYLLSFWENVFFAYCVTMPDPITHEIPKTPVFMLPTKYRSETLDSLLSQYPELMSTPEKFKNLPFIDNRGRKRGKVIETLKKYIGSSPTNQMAFEMYRRVVKFIPLLVDLASQISEKKKYNLASDFLLGYLGINLSGNQIKEQLRYKRD